MLHIKRLVGQGVVINSDIFIMITQLQPSKVQICIDAPMDVKITMLDELKEQENGDSL